MDVTDGDVMGPATAAEKQFGFTAVTPATGATIRRLARLEPRTLTVMRGSSFASTAATALESAAGSYDDLLPRAGHRAESNEPTHAVAPRVPGKEVTKMLVSQCPNVSELRPLCPVTARGIAGGVGT